MLPARYPEPAGERHDRASPWASPRIFRTHNLGETIDAAVAHDRRSGLSPLDGADEAPALPGLPDRRCAAGYSGNPHGLRDGPRQAYPAREGTTLRTARAGRKADRDHRSALSGEQGGHAAEDSAAYARRKRPRSRGIHDIRDESDRQGLRAVIEVKARLRSAEDPRRASTSIPICRSPSA